MEYIKFYTIKQVLLTNNHYGTIIFLCGNLKKFLKVQTVSKKTKVGKKKKLEFSFCFTVKSWSIGRYSNNFIFYKIINWRNN